jgi:hypothetical protein
MAGRFSRVRRAAFLVALLASAAAYAYSLSGIMGTGSELRSVVSAESAERSAPVVYRSVPEAYENCPYEDSQPPDAPRVEL